MTSHRCEYCRPKRYEVRIRHEALTGFVIADDFDDLDEASAYAREIAGEGVVVWIQDTHDLSHF